MNHPGDIIDVDRPAAHAASDMPPPSSPPDRRNIIVFFHPGHPNHVAALEYVRPALNAAGYVCETVSFSSPIALSRLAELLTTQRKNIFCFYSVNFYIKELALKNLWITHQRGFDGDDGGAIYLNQLTGIPLVVHIYDHPLYLIAHESDAFNRAVIFVNGTDIIDFMTKHFAGTYNYVPIPVPTAGNTPALVPNWSAPDFDDFLARRNEIWCPMNLSVQNLSADGHWSRINELPSARRERAIRLVDAALYDCFTPLHIVSERLDATGDTEIELRDQLHVLNFIKLWRRTTIVRALAALPIVVSSDFVPADLSRKYPEKFIRSSMSQTLKYYEHFRFSLNSFPLQTDALHDRIINPFFANSVVISDRNALSSRLFRDGIDLIFLDFEADMAAKVATYLADPRTAFQITLNVHQRQLDERKAVRHSGDGLCDSLIDAVREAWRLEAAL